MPPMAGTALIAIAQFFASGILAGRARGLLPTALPTFVLFTLALIGALGMR